MAHTSVTHVMIIKVDFDGDVRRISMELPEDAESAQTFQAIRTAVAQGFDMEDGVLPVLKYRDEEGDLCTLVAASVDDMLEFSKGGTLRLFASKTALERNVAAQEVPAPDALVSSTSDAPTGEAAAECADETLADDDAAFSHEEGVATDYAEVPATDDEAAATENEEVAATDDAEVTSIVDAEVTSADDAEAAATDDTEVPAAVDEEVSATDEEVVATADAEATVADATTIADATTAEDATVEDDVATEEDARIESPRREEEPQVQQTESVPGLSELMVMGFAEEEAKRALEVANYNLEGAVDYLTAQPEDTPFEKLDRKLRALPGNVMVQLEKLRNQLKEMVSSVRQHRARFQERVQSGEFEHLQTLQATLEEMKARLCEFKGLVQAGLKKASGSQPDAEEEEKLRKAEAQIADAQHFVSEVLAGLRARGSEALKGAATKFADMHEAFPEDDMDTMDAAAAAAVDAAEAAAATVDEFLSEEAATTSASSTEQSEAADNATRQQPERRPKLKNATRMDHAQVFLSRSVSGLRSFAMGLFGARPDPWLTVPSTSAASAAAAADDAADAANASAAASPEMSVADIANADAAQSGLSDEFLYVSVDPTEGRPTVPTTGSL